MQVTVLTSSAFILKNHKGKPETYIFSKQEITVYGSPLVSRRTGGARSQ